MKQTTTNPGKQNVQVAEIFAMLYQEKKELLDLYNAISGKHYEDPEPFGDQHVGKCHLHDDVKMICHFLSIFVFPCTSISLPTVQTCPCVILFYISDLYSGMTKNSNLYGTKLVEIPAPQFVSFL